jgi:cytochrome P450
MNDFVPARPRALEARPALIEFIRLFLRSGLASYRRETYEFIGVSRHRIPRLPFREKKYSYMVREPDAVREVLIGRARAFPKSRLMDTMLRALTGYSIFLSNGETWRRQRAIIDQAFGNARLRDVFGLMRDASDATHARLARKVPETGAVPVAIDVETAYFAADVIFRTIYSQPMSEAEARQIFRAFESFQAIAYAHSYIALAGVPAWILPSHWRGRRDAATIRRVLNRPIARRLERIARGAPTPDKDILAMLISAPDPRTGTRFDAGELLDQVAMLFLAGHETSAAALAWALYLIANRPDVQDRMRAEALSALADRAPRFSDLRRLGFIRDVYLETLRLYPPLAFLARDSAEATELCGQPIEKDAQTLVPTWLMHRHAIYWRNPDGFDPDRFSDPATRSARTGAYMPFSMGPRVCSGAAFALQEATLVLAELVRRYRFSPDPGHVPEPVSRLTLRSENGISLMVEKL